jgi:hypothetical protein
MDVRDAKFSDSNMILLTAAENGSLHLFEMRGSAAQRLFSNPDSMDSLTVHAKNGVLVRQQMEGGNWRLYGSDPSREGETQLTFGDCNAYDPAWLDETRLVYVSDCGRGEGMGALAEINLGIATGASERTWANPPHTSGPEGESQE